MLRLCCEFSLISPGAWPSLNCTFVATCLATLLTKNLVHLQVLENPSRGCCGRHQMSSMSSAAWLLYPLSSSALLHQNCVHLAKLQDAVLYTALSNPMPLSCLCPVHCPIDICLAGIAAGQIHIPEFCEAALPGLDVRATAALYRACPTIAALSHTSTCGCQSISSTLVGLPNTYKQFSELSSTSQQGCGRGRRHGCASTGKELPWPMQPLLPHCPATCLAGTR